MSLLARLAAWRWDIRITWRATRGRWFIFRDAPQSVVATWANTAPERFVRSPQLQQAVVQAQGELNLREQRLQWECENVWRAVDAALVPPEE